MREAVCAVRPSGERRAEMPGGGGVCGLWKGSRVARGVGGAEPLPWRVRGDSETPDALGRLKSPEEETPHCLSSRPQGDGAGEAEWWAGGRGLSRGRQTS